MNIGFKAAFMAATLGGSCALMAQEEFPYSPGSDQLRIVTWNIENLGNRSPPRSESDLENLAGRLLSFEAPIIAVQEIFSNPGGSRPALQTVMEHMGPEWQIAVGDGSNGVLFNSLQVNLVSGEELSVLQAPPYNSFYRDIPDWQNLYGNNGDPFSNGRSLPYMGVFQHAQSADLFYIISNHFHFGQDLDIIREYEGNAVRLYVEELLAGAGEELLIAVVGDFNAQPGSAPHPQLDSSGELHILVKENSQNTGILSEGANIDHHYLTTAALEKTADQSAFVILPEHYGESPEAFESVYSDHAPVLVDLSLATTTDELILASAWSGTWYDPAHDGEGWMIQVLSDQIVLINWYSYDDSGEQMWMTGVGSLADNRVDIDEMLITQGGLFGPDFDPDSVALEVWGSMSMTFHECDSATVEYSTVTRLGQGTLHPVRLSRIAGLDCERVSVE